MDVRPGGAWSLRMRAPEGTVQTKRGVYREVMKPERLVFTYAWDDAAGDPGPETIVSVNFAEEGPRTRLTLHQTRFASVTARDAHQGGWTSCFERFATYLRTA